MDIVPTVTIVEIMDARAKRTAALIRPQSKQPYLYLSGIHTCARNLYYRMTEGDKRQPFDTYVQDKLEAGNEQERIAKRELLELGYELIKAQERIEIRYGAKRPALVGQVMGVGKIDGAIMSGKREIPVEIKAMHPNIWGRIHTVEDLLNYQHTERYVRQLLLYLYGKSLEAGLFLLIDFMGHWKWIVVELGAHLEIAEYALAAMEKAWEAKADGIEPERIEFSSKICGTCDFAPICLPPVVIGGDAVVIEDEELKAALILHAELKVKADEYADLHEMISDRFKNAPHTTVSGRFTVAPTRRNRVSYNVKALPEDVRQSIRTEKEYVVLNIKDVDAAK